MDNRKTETLIRVLAPATAEAAHDLGANAGETITALSAMVASMAHAMGLTREEALRLAGIYYDAGAITEHKQ